MPLDQLDTLERAAAMEAANTAGDYLDGQHQTDLAKLSAQQWEELWRVFLVSYEKLLRQKIEVGGLSY